MCFETTKRLVKIRIIGLKMLLVSILRRQICQDVENFYQHGGGW